MVATSSRIRKHRGVRGMWPGMCLSLLGTGALYTAEPGLGLGNVEESLSSRALFFRVSGVPVRRQRPCSSSSWTEGRQVPPCDNITRRNLTAFSPGTARARSFYLCLCCHVRNRTSALACTELPIANRLSLSSHPAISNQFVASRVPLA